MNIHWVFDIFIVYIIYIILVEGNSEKKFIKIIYYKNR